MGPVSPVAESGGTSDLSRLLELFWHPVATLDELVARALAGARTFGEQPAVRVGEA